jgi:hypothetical protein
MYDSYFLSPFFNLFADNPGQIRQTANKAGITLIPDCFSYRIAKRMPVHITAGLPRIAPPPLSFLG